ncbi:LysM domain-containing protein [Scytonema sp. PRP1]|uniref:LysM domain-containing protein n=1 Tax=Scytonema sp. PRP1 TaxID=3120513 RepID=UPI00300D7938
MFDQTSRYYKLKTSTITVTDSNGMPREIRYVQRRFLPTTEGMATVVEHTVIQGDRLDNITARYLGNPTQFWQVCDANNVYRPDELEEIGRIIKIALPFA